ncbi:receptor-like protein Cf-9 [Capsicum annuum]|uniref:receptor-like protein Cf-9 n=1 Tax=Capsicum annuum TaxID=4072 RepID=UPI001FB15AB3|nr:receptor-like protein Cf-9 [Capsicum annuum]
MGYGRLLLLLLASFFLRHEFAFSFSSLAPQSCPEDQSLALIEFNKTLVVNASLATLNCQFYEAQKAYPRTSSWVMSKDCCSWDGVICDEMTGHVIELNLSCSQLVGNIDTNSSLFQLTYLQRLDLSGNDFSNSQISPNFGRFTSLTHLDLSHSSFSGQIPSEISHLSKLQSLGLSGDFALFFDDELGLPPHDFKLILQNLTQLRELDLRYVNIFSSIPLNFSSHLTTLKLGGTGLNGIIPESIFHLPNLQVLNLEGNNALSGNFSKTKWNSSRSLVDLSLSAVNFSGDFLPYSLVYVTSLQFLVLYSCNLLGPIPKSLWNLTHLEYLDLRNNHLEGATFPPFTNGLQNLNTLWLSNNSLNGEIPS